MDRHTSEMITALAAVMKAEGEIAQIREWVDSAQSDIARHESAAGEGWGRIAALMAETGEVEVRLPSSTPGHEFRVYRRPPHQSVSVTDADAVPDEFVKLERKPRLKEIGDHLKALRDAGWALPNWAALKSGEAKLAYKLQKRK